MIDLGSATVVLTSQELRLLVRSPATVAALDDLIATILAVLDLGMLSSVSGGYNVAFVEPEELDGFAAAQERCRLAVIAFESAIRRELGSDG